MSDPLWFKEAIIYELHVKTFQDSNEDGIGDLRGLLQRLDYLAELGVTAIWMLPFYPSPLRDDGYDIADYKAVNPSYGTLEDFQAVLDAAHERGLKIITELVLNHTSDQHAWFQRARRAPAGSPEREFYVWSDDPHRYKDARIIFKDFESSNWSWDPVAKSNFWHRFYSHQPDLNFENPAVQEELLGVIDFWLEKGVDGVRLDAVPYLYEREGTNCENLAETHAFLRKLRRHIDQKFENRMLLAEANQWPEDAAAYFGDGDECHMNFHFPLMPRLFMSLQMEDRFPIIDILEQTPAIHESCQWAIFLRNHDELTLEMVTDEERDYMYHVYAADPRARINLGIRRRLAPLLGDNRRKVELINSLLFSLPGTPIIYYGDEIGMGDNFYLGDRNGVRTPMQWSADRNAGFSRANPQQLFLPVIIDPEYHYEAINVENQQKNPSSLFWWMRRLLAVRRRYHAFAYGTLEFLHPDNAKVLAYLRQHDDQTLLIVANLSRFVQVVELDLSAFAGRVPEEMFGRSKFPEIKRTPTVFTLGPHNFYWFLIRPAATAAALHAQWSPVAAAHSGKWDASLLTLLTTQVLPAYLPTCVWFGDPDREIREMKILHDVPFNADGSVHILVAQAILGEGLPKTCLLPLGIVDGERATQLLTETPQVVLATLAGGAAICDAFALTAFREALLRSVLDQRRLKAGDATLLGETSITPEAAEIERALSATRVIGGDESNICIVYGEMWVLKIYRMFRPGENPELEILRHVNGGADGLLMPRFEGALTLKNRDGVGAVGVLMNFIQNQGDGATYTRDALSRFFDRVIAARGSAPNSDAAAEAIGGVFPERARQLGQRTGQMHTALAAIPGPAFEPEVYSALYQRSVYQALRGSAGRVLRELRIAIPDLPPSVQGPATELVARQTAVQAEYVPLLGERLDTWKIRLHGDYRLGQVLNTGKDLSIIDLEGMPHHSLGERVLKRSPAIDLARMLRSIDRAVRQGLRAENEEDRAGLLPWAMRWRDEAAASFLSGYLETTSGVTCIPSDRRTLRILLGCFILGQAMEEIRRDLPTKSEVLLLPVSAALEWLEHPGELLDRWLRV